MKRHLYHGQPFIFVFPATGIGPAADPAQEMQLTGGKAGFELDPLRQRPGETVAAFQDDDVVSGRTLGRTDDVKRKIADLDRAEFPEPERLVFRVLTVEEAALGVG